eukprot:TRINITY_DN862_c0_g2_i2.p2 TRINITY_DN862_c0_g2~~TRINITY_DN862_c0_g2_i2.p2  ORF type:complete len:112 (-),score=18.91 TRINITY_DN862_c0_g2_i2:633-968(-)
MATTDELSLGELLSLVSGKLDDHQKALSVPANRSADPSLLLTIAAAQLTRYKRDMLHEQENRIGQPHFPEPISTASRLVTFNWTEEKEKRRKLAEAEAEAKLRSHICQLCK